MKLGFVGLGNIGGAIARNLVDDGHEVHIFDLDEQRRQVLSAAGAHDSKDVAEVARQSEITFLSLPTPDVVDVVADEWLAASPTDAILVDLSTNAPERVRALGERLAARGRYLLDAPLSGGAPGAQSRMLMFMVGGDAEPFGRVQPIFEAVGRATFHLGPLGSGTVAKLVNSLIAFSTTMASLEGLSVAVKNGIDLRQMVNVVRTGGAGNFYTDRAVEGIGHRADTAQFALELAAKDAQLIASLESQSGLSGRIAKTLQALLDDACAAGMGRRDWTALPAFFEEEGGVEFVLRDG